MDSVSDLSSDQLHVAQQSRREKLRVQLQHSPSRSGHGVEEYVGRFEVVQPLLNPDLIQVVGDVARNSASSLLYEPAGISPELLLSFSNNNLTSKATIMSDQVSMLPDTASPTAHQVRNPRWDKNLENCGVWRSVGPNSNSGNWNAECVTENRKNVSVAVSAHNVLISRHSSGRPLIESHQGEITSGSQHNYENGLSDEVTTTVAGLQPTCTIRGNARGSYIANNELVHIASYGDQPTGVPILGSSSCNGELGSLHNRCNPIVVNPQAQGLSLSLCSNPANSMIHESDQYGNDCIPQSIPFRMVADSIFQDSKSFSGTDVLRSASLAHGNSLRETVGASTNYHGHTGPLGPFTGYAIILKSSRFLKPAQQLLDDYCGVIGKFASTNALSPRNMSKASDLADAVASMESEVGKEGDFSSGSATTYQDSDEIIGEGVASSSGESRRPDYQLKKAKLLYMLGEVTKRYRQYYQQMQMVVSAFESVAGLAAATPYISCALKTVSRHFNYLKNAISEQLKHIKTFSGENFSSQSSEARNKGDSNFKRLKYLDLSFQKSKPSGSNIGLLEPQQHIWRPQRGLPERAVSVLRAWLFEHFLHPYPTDTDKHMLATQTGLTRSQVSNWFINARVRLWKPMVEEIHMLETKGLAEKEIISVDNDKAYITESNDQPVGNSSNKVIGSSVPRMNMENPGLGTLSAMTDVVVPKQWNLEKQSQVDNHVTSSMDGGLISFSQYHHQNGYEIGGIGPVSLTLGLWQSADQMYRVEGSHSQQHHQQQLYFQQQQQDHARHQPGGYSVHEFAVMRTGAVNSASGSAYAEFGNTKVIVSVAVDPKVSVRIIFLLFGSSFGPRESKKAMMYSDVGRLNCSVNYTTFASPTCGKVSDHKEFSTMLHKALEGAIILETFPKTTVDVFALILQSGGGDLPVVISCASLALANAGIMMYDLVAFVSVSYAGRNLLIDPISEEENNEDGSLMIACMPSRNEVTQLTITGEWSTCKTHEAMQLCLDACLKLSNIMRMCVKDAASSNQE